MTSVISAETLADLRLMSLDFMPDTYNLLTPTNTPNGKGGVTVTWGTVAAGSALPCRAKARTLASSNGTGQGVSGGKVTLSYVLELTVTYDAPIASNQRVEYGGDTYTITNLSDIGSWAITRKATLERIP